MTPRNNGDETTSGTLARGLTILEVVASHPNVGAAEIATRLGISRSAAYRLIGQLKERGFLSERHGGGLRLGGGAVRLGLQALGDVHLYDVAADRLRSLVETVQETAFLAIADGQDVVYVLQEVGPSAVTMTAKPGSRRPLYATALGKAYLAALPEAELEDLLPTVDMPAVTPSTITTREALRAELEATRARGYAIDDRELEPEVRCLAAVVRDHRDHPVAAISVGGPYQRISAREEHIVAAVTATARQLSDDLGAH
ncbi:IclR family transcriptional regulator [Ruania halotolerans]|uniref:IclR family transcriptional regulator n=1 Tax=Ruania halotolerans TaxID=2897773 RepID=UPI001E536922|nr:IclR family transcriptional regulator [Ruania halotolerans]UFU07928.1 IclR family transcriptional regulator [Ruania halotolerans]